MALNLVKKPAEKTVSEWCDYLDEEGNVLASFQIAGIDRQSFQVEREVHGTALRDYKHELAAINDRSKTFNQNLVEATARHLIMGWKNIFIDGEEFEYSPENAVLLLTQRSTPEDENFAIKLWGWIFSKATDIQVKANAKKAATVGKPSKSTIGKEDTGT